MSSADSERDTSEVHLGAGVGAPDYRRKRRTRLKLLIAASSGLLLALAALFATLSVTGSLVLEHFLSEQESRIQQIRTEVEALPEGHYAGWSDTPIPDSTPLTKVQMIATHNSYAIAPNTVQRLAIELAQPGLARTLAYSHPSLWEQLNLGIRSLELDVRPHRNGDFGVTHVPMVANGSSSPDLKLALEEIELWSSSHPKHLPIVLLIEFKSDLAFLDQGLDTWNPETLTSIDRLLREQLDNSLLTPRDLSSEDWPNVGSLRGRVLVIMHPGEPVVEQYLSIPLEKRSMLVGTYADSASLQNQPEFVVQNDPDVRLIERLIESGAMVRTRADTDLEVDAERVRQAIDSGAQIISTDFPEYPTLPGTGVAHALEHFEVGFGDGQLVRQVP